MKKFNLILIVLGILIVPMMFLGMRANAQTVGDTLVGQYTYSDPEGDPEGISLFQWYRDGIAISGATSRTYLVVADDVGHTIVFEVTPISLTGISPGIPFRSTGILIVPPCSTGCVTGGATEVVGSTTVVATTTATTTLIITDVTGNTNVSEVEQGPFTHYLKLNSKNNDVNEVKLWQEFLNKELGLNIPITGFFGNQTFKAVKAFQAKYASQVLSPWDITEPTGYVYKTTRALGNKLFLNHLEGKVLLDNGVSLEFK